MLQGLPRVGRAEAVLVAIGALAVFVVQWSWEIPLTNDGPSYLFNAVVANHYDDAAFGFSEHFLVNRPVTENGPANLMALLEPTVGPLSAMRWIFVFAAEALFVSTFMLALAAARLRDQGVGPGVIGLSALGAALCVPFQRSLYFGMLPFLFGSAIAVAALAATLAARRSSGLIVVGLLFTLGAWVHPVPTGLGGLCVGVVVVAGPQRGRRLLVLAASCVPALWILARSAGALGDHRGGATDIAYAPLVERTLTLLSRFTVAAAPLSVALLALVCWGIVCGARTRDLRARVLAVAAAILVLLSMAMPEHLLGWQAASGRPLALAVPVALALLVFVPVRTARVTMVCAVVLGVVLEADAWRRHGALALSSREALSGYEDAAPAPLPLLEIITRPFGSDRQDLDAVPVFVEPMARLAAVWATRLGGRPFHILIDTPRFHGLLLKPHEPLAPFPVGRADEVPEEPERRKNALRILASSAAALGGVFAFGLDMDARVYEEAGFERVAGTGPLFIGRFVGCTTIARLHADRALDATLTFGWWPRRTPWSAARQVHIEPGPLEIPLGVSGCGEMWLQIDGARCVEGAPVRGMVRRGADNVLECTIGAAAAAAP